MDKSKRDLIRGQLLEKMPKGARCAEVGVWEGKFSARILAITEPAELHLIDPWLYQPEFTNTGFGRKKNESLMDEKYHAVVARYANDPRVTIHRAMSDAALSALPDGHLDWIYLDGNHNAPFIDQDLALSLLKVKADGIIAGDDYNWMADSSGAPVKQAVKAVMEQLGEKANLTLMANQYILRLKRS